MDEHLDRDIRQDDVYEELAPTTYCKLTKNALSQSPALFFCACAPSKIKGTVKKPALIHFDCNLSFDRGLLLTRVIIIVFAVITGFPIGHDFQHVNCHPAVSQRFATLVSDFQDN